MSPFRVYPPQMKVLQRKWEREDTVRSMAFSTSNEEGVQVRGSPLVPHVGVVVGEVRSLDKREFGARRGGCESLQHSRVGRIR